jgi:WD40 repeat protein
MKRPWTRREKWLWAAPLLFGFVAAAMTFGPQAARRLLGWPTTLTTTPDTYIRSMALSRNGEVLAAGGLLQGRKAWERGSGTVYLWNAHTGKRLTMIPPVYTRDRSGFILGWDIYALTLSPDAKQIGFSRMDQNWALYDVATQQQLWRFSRFIKDAEFSQDGRFIALSSDTHISIVSASDGRVRTQWRRSGSANSSDVSWSPDGTLVATIERYKGGGPIELHRADDGKLVRRIKNEGAVSVAFSPDSRRLIIASSVFKFVPDDKFSRFAPVHCYDAATGRLLWKVTSPTFGGADSSHSSFCDAIFSPDGHVVAAYQYSYGKVFLLDSVTGAIKSTRQLGRTARSIFSVPPSLAFSPDGKRLFVRGRSAVLFWDLE